MTFVGCIIISYCWRTVRATVEARGQFLLTQRSAGNENRRWHGTKRECNLGDKGVTSFCSSPACSLCRIIQTSYNSSLAGSFGSGVYTSSTSSKSVPFPDITIRVFHIFRSNYFSRNVSQSPWKAILLNKVVVGKGYKLSATSPTLTAPPAGYDSVSIALAIRNRKSWDWINSTKVLYQAGTSLCEDELVIYTSDAVRPSYLVMYDA